MALLHVFLITQTFAQLYDFQTSSVFILNTLNFDKQITNNRDKYVSIVHFYKENDGKSYEISQQFKQFSDDMQGVYTIASVDCEQFADVCEKQRITEFPSIKVYPPYPAPVMDYTGEHNSKGYSGFCSRFLNNNVIALDNDKFQGFIGENPSVPKVLLFTDKKGIPNIFKSLSIAFENKMHFGLVRPEHDEICQKYKVKSFPKILVVKTSDPKPKEYQGELKYREIFNWLNVYSETFVAGGEKSASDKPWLLESIPELHRMSGDDICFKKEGSLCAILLLETEPKDQIKDVAKRIKNKYAGSKDRGAEIAFMWLDVNNEPDWGSIFQVESRPAIVFLKHGKRNRYVVFDGEWTEGEIEASIDKILGGDGKFKQIKGGLPTFSARKL